MDERVILKPSNRAKRLSLRLNHKERCIDLVMPKRSSKTMALIFARKHQDWIEEKLDSLPSPIPFIDSATIPLMGEAHKISITQDMSRKKTSVKIENGFIQVITNLSDPSQRIKRAVKQYAAEEFTSLTYEKASLISKKVSKVTLRDTSTRWGSCTSEGNISLSWRLIFAPIEAIDYVIAHEVAHLRHLDHSKAFWTLCQSLSKDFEKGKPWIHHEGYSLMRYGSII